MTEQCTFPLCKLSSYRDGFCIHHAKNFAGQKVKPEAKKIPIKSAKRVVEEKLYKKIVKEMLVENPNCEIKELGCQGKANGLHHQKKRTGKNYLDRRYLIRACNNCNTWAELHPLEAIKKGVSISKFSQTN